MNPFHATNEGKSLNKSPNVSVPLRLRSGFVLFILYSLLSYLSDLSSFRAHVISILAGGRIRVDCNRHFWEDGSATHFLGGLFSVLISIPYRSVGLDEIAIRCLGFSAANALEAWVTVSFANFLHNRSTAPWHSPTGFLILGEIPWNPTRGPCSRYDPLRY